MSRRNWRRVRPTSLRNAMELAKDRAREVDIKLGIMDGEIVKNVDIANGLAPRRRSDLIAA